MGHTSEAIGREVANVVAAMNRLRTLMHNVDGVEFSTTHQHFEELERALDTKATIDAAFAFVADRAEAGRMVSSTRTIDYLMKRLRLTHHEATARLSNGNRLFAPEPEPEPEDDAAVEEHTALLELRLKASKGDAVPEKMATMIERELKNLSPKAQPGPHRLRVRATDLGKEKSYTFVRDWLRRQIRQANESARENNPFAALAKRRLAFSRPDADGGIFINGYVDAATAAMLKSAFAPARNSGSADLSPAEDRRTFEQRMADQLAHIVGSFLSASQNPQHGIGSVVMTTTLEDVENLSPSTRLATSAGVELNPLDALRIGAARHDFLCVVDEQGVPLDLRRTKRTASVWQKLALAASELVCTHPDCSRPWVECDVHHLQAWSFGGMTDLKNLTLLCRAHHVNNNDRRNGANNMGHAERCPITGRVGFRDPTTGRILLNDHPAAKDAAGQRAVRRIA